MRQLTKPSMCHRKGNSPLSLGFNWHLHDFIPHWSFTTCYFLEVPFVFSGGISSMAKQYYKHTLYYKRELCSSLPAGGWILAEWVMNSFWMTMSASLPAFVCVYVCVFMDKLINLQCAPFHLVAPFSLSIRYFNGGMDHESRERGRERERERERKRRGYEKSLSRSPTHGRMTKSQCNCLEMLLHQLHSSSVSLYPVERETGFLSFLSHLTYAHIKAIIGSFFLPFSPFFC